jgi:hypothetical protein
VLVILVSSRGEVQFVQFYLGSVSFGYSVRFDSAKFSYLNLASQIWLHLISIFLVCSCHIGFSCAELSQYKSSSPQCHFRRRRLFNFDMDPASPVRPEIQCSNEMYTISVEHCS